MNDRIIRSKIKKILIEILDLDDLSDDASDQNIDEWDSLTYLTILMRIEEEFKITINEKNIDSFNSYKNIVKIVTDAKK